MRANGHLSALCLAVLVGGGVDMEIKSPAFPHDAAIPSRYTCDGADQSPPLSFSGVPEGTKSFALIMDDPDAPNGTWVHWVVWNIPSKTRSLAESVQKSATLPDGTHQGVNDFQRTGYGGPCPPGGTHRYYFKLYALDQPLELKGGSTKKDLETSMQGHILGQAELIGKYTRR
jgi:Raf kinase inhibitor-like YbhB/YbcL family protein